jgi:hypothetical protein
MVTESLPRLPAMTEARHGTPSVLRDAEPVTNRVSLSAVVAGGRMAERVLFARVGWMTWYKGVRSDDPKPLGGGAYNEEQLGYERFNFLSDGNRYLGYFQPQLQPKERREIKPSTIHLERIEPGYAGDKLKHVLVIFIAPNPDEGGQYVVGWYPDATVYRHEQNSTLEARQEVGFYLETVGESVLVPNPRRSFLVPGRKGGFGRANICYTHDDQGNKKLDSPWVADAVEYVKSYKHENAAKSPESATDPDIAGVVEDSIEGGAGYQSNPRIRRAVEDYAMAWAEKWLRKRGFNPKDKHKTESYDFLCASGGADLFVEVKGTQTDGTCIALTPNEVAHVKRYSNSVLFIVYGVQVKDSRYPRVTGGKELILMPWDINAGKLEPRGFTFTVPQDAFLQRDAARSSE